VFGTVTQPGGATTCNGANGLGEASVSLNSGSSTFAVTTASTPAGDCGKYRIEQLPPGTYTLTVSTGTGTSPSSQVLTLQAGEQLPVNVNLARPATMSGVVVSAQGTGDCGWTVQLFAVAQYPNVATATTTTTKAGAGGVCSGAFSFAGIPAGSYILSAGATPTNSSATLSVTLQPSQQLTGIRIEVP
jgi:hypothetical protein